MAIATTVGVALADVRLHEAEEAVPASGLGAVLRTARDRRGVSLDQISNETKIPRRHLEALEREDLSVAPGGIYLRAEVRAYARAVHVDESLALERLERLLNPPAAPGETRAPARASAADRRPIVLTSVQPWTALAVLALTAVLASISWWSSGQGDVGSADSTARGGEPELTARDTSGVDTSVADRDATVAASETTAVTRDAARDPAPAGHSRPLVPAPAPPSRPLAPPVKTPRSTEIQRTTRPVEAPRSAEDTDTSAPTEAITELLVATQPPGARVTVDGISWGTSPVTIRHLSPGAKRIRVSLDGYASAERSVNLAAGRRQRIEVPLRGR